MTKVKVLNNEQMADGTFRLTLENEHISQTSHAGNFINVKVPQCDRVLWRRPFSVHSTNPANKSFQILISAIGRGTSVLKDLKAGEFLDIVGPLGNSFYVRNDLKELIIVGGGIGIAPFKLLLEDAKNIPCKKTVFFGVGTEKQFCCLKEFEELGGELILSTDDGSKGYSGFVTTPLEQYLDKLDDKDGAELFVCGPTPMMNTVKQISEKHNIKAQVTVENVMACGFGACVGCPVPLANPTEEGKLYKLACKDGPVFDMSEILLND
jgi:dihydroorotate dehydrogenase electron transfer subunit